MDRRVVFSGKLLPLLLLLPQLTITVLFFYLPTVEAVHQSTLLQDSFGTTTEFVGLENYKALLQDPSYLNALWVTVIFSILVTVLSLSVALLLAVQADKKIRGSGFFKTMIIWPYAVAPVIAGVLYLMIFHPSLGILGRFLNSSGVGWNPFLSSSDAMILVVLTASWKQISYNFLFFLAGLQSIPQSLLEAAAIDGAGRTKRFWTITFPLLAPMSFYVLIATLTYVFFDTFGIIEGITHGGPAGSTTTLVYKVYADGRAGGDLGLASAQSVILMVIVITLTALQFRALDKRIGQ